MTPEEQARAMLADPAMKRAIVEALTSKRRTSITDLAGRLTPEDCETIALVEHMAWHEGYSAGEADGIGRTNDDALSREPVHKLHELQTSREERVRGEERERAAALVEQRIKLMADLAWPAFSAVIQAIPDAIRDGATGGDGWQPIETAPRDGTWFMTINAGFAGPEPEIEIGAYDPSLWPEYVEVSDGLYRKQEKTVYEWRGFDNFHRATHWCPLPAPPAIRSAPSSQRGD